MNKTLPKIALLALSILFSLGMVELCLRVFLPLPPSVYELDDYYLYALVPKSEKTFIHHQQDGGESVHVQINSKGFRGEEFRGKEGAARIVVYGDSYIEAQFSRLEHTFAKQLESLLNPGDRPPVEVINAGILGYGPDQISLKIENEIDELAPDLIVVAVFADNDFGDLLRNKIYRLDSNNTLTRNDYRVSDKLRAIRKSNPIRILKVAREAYWRLSGSYKNKNKFIGKWLRESRDEYEDYLNNNEVTNIMNDHYDADISLEPNSESARYKSKLMEQVILKIKQVTDSRNIPLILLIIPSPVDACDDFDVGINGSVYADYKRSTLTDIFEGIARRNGISHVNLFEHFRRRGANGLYFHYGDDHWNTAGQSLAADVMAEFIASKKVLDSAPRPTRAEAFVR